MHSRKLYCIAKSFTAPQKVLLHSRKFYHIAEKLIRGRNWRKVPSMAEAREKFFMQ